MTNFVFFNANDAHVKVTVNDTVVGYADTVGGLVELFLQNNLTHNDTFMHQHRGLLCKTLIQKQHAKLCAAS